MRFEFDPAKAASNLKKHGVSFADAEALFEDPLALHTPDPDAEGEERLVAMGLGGAGELLVVVYALRGTAIRLISARRATKREARAYAS
jgi:uncharacterized DUF497 family protein